MPIIPNNWKLIQITRPDPEFRVEYIIFSVEVTRNNKIDFGKIWKSFG